METLKGFIELGRPLNAVMVFVATLVGGVVAGGDVGCILLASLSAMLISMGAQSINDWKDYELDRKKGNRPLHKYSLPRDTALHASLIYYSSGMALSFLLSPLHFLVAILVTLLSAGYSLFMGKMKYLGNMVVSLAVGLSFVYGGLCGNVWNTLLPGFLAFLMNWGREIVKDVEDGEVDYPEKVSLYHLVGKELALYHASYLVLLSVFLSPFPYILGIMGFWYIPFVLLANLIFFLAVYYIVKGDVSRGSMLIKVGMLVALLSFAVGAWM